MSRKLFLAATAAAWLIVAPASVLAQGAPAHITAAVADASRPAADKERDASRKPAEMLAFAEIKPGQKVLEIIPGGGYFTRLLSKAVGPTGKVYAAAAPQQATQLEPVTKDAAYANVQVIPPPLTGAATVPEKVDVIFTAQNYHDLHLTRLNLDVATANKALFEALKPGGHLIVIDHAAAAGADTKQVANTLHRIDPAAARKEIEAAGFQFVAESNAIRNPADDKTKGVFDASVRGKTDQFVHKYKKPG